MGYVGGNSNFRKRNVLTPLTLGLEAILLIVLLLLVVFFIIRMIYRRFKRSNPTDTKSVIVETVDVTTVSGWALIILALITAVYYIFFSWNDNDWQTRRRRLLAYGVSYVIVSFVFFFAILLFVKNNGERAIEWNDNVVKSAEFVRTNVVWCETVCQESCQRPVIELPPYDSIPIEWSPNLTAYCIDLIYREAAVDKGEKIVPPQGLKVDATFKGLALSVPAATFVSENDPSKTIVWFVARGGGPEALLGYDPREVIYSASVTNGNIPFTMVHPLASTELTGMLNDDGETPSIPSDLTVNVGFWLIYQAIRPQWIDYLKSLPPNSNRQILFTGHSSGATYATFAAYDAAVILLASPAQIIVYVFGSPRIMNYDLSPIVTKYWRIYNGYDTVSNYPLSVTPNPFDPVNPFFYADQGLEGGMAFACNQWGASLNHGLVLFYSNISKMKPSV